MKITYDNEQNFYFVVIDDQETTLLFNTDDIAEVRDEFVKCMTRLFNNAVCEKFKCETPKETLTNKICETEEDHEWECCGMSTEGSDYRCKKCGKYKFVPFTSSSSSLWSSNHYEEDLL